MSSTTHTTCGCGCSDGTSVFSPEELKAWFECEDNATLEKTLAEKLALLRREDVSKPAIFIGTGTCGLGAGAGKTLAAVRAWKRKWTAMLSKWVASDCAALNPSWIFRCPDGRVFHS